MAEVAGEIGGVVVLVATEGGALLSFGFEKKGGAAEISGLGATNGEAGKLPLFPLIIKREGADVSPFRIKNPPRSLPRCRIQCVPLGEGAVGTEQDSALPGPRVPVPCFGPGPTALGTVCGLGPGAPVSALE